MEKKTEKDSIMSKIETHLHQILLQLIQYIGKTNQFTSYRISRS